MKKNSTTNLSDRIRCRNKLVRIQDYLLDQLHKLSQIPAEACVGYDKELLYMTAINHECLDMTSGYLKIVRRIKDNADYKDWEKRLDKVLAITCIPIDTSKEAAGLRKWLARNHE